jgi:hypothetical protein
VAWFTVDAATEVRYVVVSTAEVEKQDRTLTRLPSVDLLKQLAQVSGCANFRVLAVAWSPQDAIGIWIRDRLDWKREPRRIMHRSQANFDHIVR